MHRISRARLRAVESLTQSTSTPRPTTPPLSQMSARLSHRLHLVVASASRLTMNAVRLCCPGGVKGETIVEHALFLYPELESPIRLDGYG